MQRSLVSLVLAFAIFFPGCSVGSFIGAYFNTFYNAQKQFSEAEAEILQPAAAGFGTRNEKPFLAAFDVPPQTKAKFVSVIEKCSKLLQYHPDSKLVDDALLMIGKSYYYQNEHQSAERKFKELLSSYPESDLVFETKLLLARTYYRKNDKATAATAARELIQEAREANEDAIVAKAALLLAHIDVENKDYAGGIENYRIAAELGETPEERSAAYRSVAEMYIQQGEFKKAEDAYVHSQKESKDYVGVYRGQIGQARMLSKQGESEKSISLLEELIANRNYREYFGEIDLEIANVYRDQKDYPSAEAQYRYVDTAYARTEMAANSYYQLGLMYETKLMKYDSARVAYDKGKAEYPSAEVTPALVRRSEFLNRYSTLRTAIARLDSVRHFILHPPIDTTKSTVLLQDSTKDALLARDSTSKDSTNSKALAKIDSAARKAPAIPPPPIDTVEAHLAFNESELAGLFYSSLEGVDSSKYWYTRLLLDHPRSNYAARALYTLAQIQRRDSTVGSFQIDSLHREITKRFPESEFAAESRRQLGIPEAKKVTDPAEVIYVNAESNMKKGDVATALKAFKGIVERDTTSMLAAKAQYTIGWIYENVNPNADSSVVNYQRLVKRFPNSQYALLVQPKLAEVESERQKKLQEIELDKQKKLQEARRDSVARQVVAPKTDEGIQKKIDEKIVPPPPTETPNDALFGDDSRRKIIKKHDDDNPKP